MIKLQSKYALSPQSICEHQSSQDGRYAWFLCVAHEENDIALEEILAGVKLEVLNAKVLEISKMEIENWLKSFFADFHWKLHASLRRTNLREKGLSLFFAVCFDHDLIFVQFGRLFCAVTNGKKLETVGRNWKNYHVQSLKNLNLLGLSEEDIRVKPQKFHLKENESLVVLPGKVAAKVFGSSPDVSSLQPLVESFSSASPALWLILKHQTPLAKPKKRRLTKLEISTLFLLLGTALAIIYMALGNRIIGVGFYRAKKVVNEKIEQAITVLNMPARNVQLVRNWSMELPFRVTSSPAFNQQNVFLVSGADIYAYKLSSREQLWKQNYPAPVVAIMTTTAGLNATLANGNTLGLDLRGNEVWSQSLQALANEKSNLTMLEITPAQEKRIDKNLTVLPLRRGLAILDSQQGKLMSELALPEELRYISKYDDYNSCFYLVTQDSLVCVNLNIVN